MIFNRDYALGLRYERINPTAKAVQEYKNQHRRFEKRSSAAV